MPGTVLGMAVSGHINEENRSLFSSSSSYQPGKQMWMQRTKPHRVDLGPRDGNRRYKGNSVSRPKMPFKKKIEILLLLQHV